MKNNTLLLCLTVIILLGTNLLCSVSSLKTFKKASEARIFTKSNDVTVIGIFADLKSEHAAHYKAAAKLWENSGVQFALATDKSKSFRAKFGDDRLPALWAQVNFREDGSLRRGKKRRVGFFMQENVSRDTSVQNYLYPGIFGSRINDWGLREAIDLFDTNTNGFPDSVKVNHKKFMQGNMVEFAEQRLDLKRLKQFKSHFSR